MQIGSIVQYTPDGTTEQPGVVLAVLSPTSASILVLGPLISTIHQQGTPPKSVSVTELSINTASVGTGPNTFKVISNF